MLVLLPLILLANFFVMKTAGFSSSSLGRTGRVPGSTAGQLHCDYENISRLLDVEKIKDSRVAALEGLRQVYLHRGRHTGLSPCFCPSLYPRHGRPALRLVLTIASIVAISLLVALTAPLPGLALAEAQQRR